jgi:hypothetical protein
MRDVANPTQLIAGYTDAFRSASPHLPSPTIEHDGKGNFTITTSCRHAPISAGKLVEMTERLQARAKGKRA